MDLIDRMLKHDAWTTNQLLDCSLGLSDECLDRRFEIGHKTVRATFIHIIGNMRVWFALMSGGKELGAALQPGASIAHLRQCHDEVATKLFDLARQVVDQARLDDTFIDELDSPPRRKTFGGGILHLTTHGMHHRAQLMYMLRRLDVQGLPEGDALSWEKQHIGGWQEA